MASPVCFACRYFLGQVGGGWLCTVFLAGIPGEIIGGDNGHDQPVDGDNGYRFEKIGDDGLQGVLPPPPST